MAQPKPKPFTPEEREELLAEAFDLISERQALADEYEAAGEGDDEPIGEELDKVHDRLGELDDEYRERLPAVPISRCPFCDRVINYPIDHMDLDGLWWNSDNPVRPDPELYDPHFVGVSGALKLAGRIAKAPFLAEPGPEVPFVVPRVMQLEGVVAVVSSLQIGPHAGYPVVYYADPVAEAMLRVNTWGMESYRYCTPDGEQKWGETADFEDDYDYDLAKWMRDGRLRWIAPGDGDLALHSGAAGCPYLDLSGRRETLSIQDGEVWGSSDMEEEDEE